MGFLVVTSERAGGADRRRVDTAVGVLARHAPVEVAAVDGEGPLDRALRALGGRTLVVAGGDGSVHLVVTRLRALGFAGEVAVGIVPLGTGNDLARGLGIPLDPALAAARAATGRPRRLDVAVADDGTVVVNAAHAGVGAEAARRAAAWKPRLGPLAYPLGGLVAGVGARGWRLRVEADGAVLADGDVLMAAVGNGPTIGGGAPLAPGADPGDGWLDVLAVTATEAHRRAGFARALRRGAHLGRGDVRWARARTASITGEPVRHNVDGEVSPPLASRSYRVEPAAWTVVH